MTTQKPQTQIGRFVYKNYSFTVKKSDLHIDFLFVQKGIEQGDVVFKPRVTIKNVDPKVAKRKKNEIETLVFNLGLIEMLSYWKAVLSPEIVVEAGHLTKGQCTWWEDFIKSGAMGEFFYNNTIDFTKKDLVTIKTTAKTPKHQQRGSTSLVKNTHKKVLLQMSGGKDSLTAYEILKEAGLAITCFMLNPTKETISTLKIADCSDTITVNRAIDKNLLALNKEGYLNGHTPFSIYLMFLSTLAAVLFDRTYIVAANNITANYGSTKHRGQIVNHQFAKSSHAENLFRDYEKKYLKTKTDYFSFLRPLNDLTVIKLFAEYGTKYFSDFSSCNNQTKKWCNKCAKCMSTYTVLSPFLEKNTLKKIFGKDLLADKTLTPLLRELSSKDRRPLDCIATQEEILAVLDKNKKKINQLLNYWNKDHNLPQEFESILKNALRTTKERISNYLEDKKIVILGFGKEGQSTLKFLRTLLPKTTISIADRNENIVVKDKNTVLSTGKNYLKELKKYDLIFKTPGLFDTIDSSIPGSKITSQTKLFLKYCLGTVVGITGTEGKSTTSFLIYTILKEAGLPVHLVGNIGTPTLDYLLEANKDDIFVYELSSYQLQDIEESPHISVFLNIFPDHLDYHKNFTNYLNAKKNITKFQNKNDYFIYNVTQIEIRKIANKSSTIKIDYTKEKINNFTSAKNIYRESVQASVAVARLFDVKESVIKKVVKEFNGLEHRLEYVGKYNGIVFYNDSASKVPEATVYALKTLGTPVETLIIGGLDRGVDLSAVISHIKKSKIKNLILLDATGKKIGKKITSNRIQKYYADSMKEAVKLAYTHTSKNKICLLSPAAVSYGMFKNFDDRGEQFKKFVSNFK